MMFVSSFLDATIMSKSALITPGGRTRVGSLASCSLNSAGALYAGTIAMHPDLLVRLFGPHLFVSSLWIPFLMRQQSSKTRISSMKQATEIICIIVKVSKITSAFSSGL